MDFGFWPTHSVPVSLVQEFYALIHFIKDFELIEKLFSSFQQITVLA